MNKDSKKWDISIRQYAFGSRDNTVVDFDARNKLQLGSTLAELGRILTTKFLIVARGCDFSRDSEPRFDAFVLTKNALDILVSALHMARQRAVVETMSLLRVALECGRTALHVSRDSEAYRCYKSGTYQSTEAISFAKKFIPILGEIYGVLSKLAVHTNIIGFGPELELNGEGEFNRFVSMELSDLNSTQTQDAMVLNLISLGSAMILKIMELSLFENSLLYDKALRLVGTQTIYISNTDAKIVQFYEQLRSYAPIVE